MTPLDFGCRGPELNQIPTIQNTPKQLARLRAQRCLYSRAKTILAIQIGLSKSAVPQPLRILGK
jgi:hypothetical protein